MIPLKGRTIHGLRPRHVALTVRNLEGSTRWYCDLFDLHEVHREESSHRRAVVLGAPGGGMHLALVEHPGTPDQAFDPKVVGLDHAAWSVATREDVDRWQELLAAMGIVHSAIVDYGVVSILNLKDPDGIALALFWDETPV